ncbi:MAG: ribonuclease E/G, partial [Pseudomonadota bacterium]
LEMSRQRLRPGMLEASTAPCPHCHGTGRTRSDDSLALAIMRELEEEGVRQRSKEVLVTAPVNIANYILNAKREHVAMVESRFGLSVRVEGVPGMISPEYKVERFNTATRVIPPAAMASALTAEPFADLADEDLPVEPAPEPEASNTDEQPKKRRRRRRRKSGRANGEDSGEAQVDTATDSDAPAEVTAEEAPAPRSEDGEKKPRSRSRSRRRSKPDAEPATADAATPEAAESIDAPEADAEPILLVEPQAAETGGDTLVAEAPAAEAPVVEAPVVEAEKPAKPTRKPRARASAKATIEGTATDPADPPLTAPEAASEADTSKEAPKRKGWWSRAIGS